LVQEKGCRESSSHAEATAQKAQGFVSDSGQGPAFVFPHCIPYKKVKPEKVKLLKRSKKRAYDDQATLKGRNFVPEKYRYSSFNR
jgi:hypothetical protein